jgi:hypothetical protein
LNRSKSRIIHGLAQKPEPSGECQRRIEAWARLRKPGTALEAPDGCAQALRVTEERLERASISSFTFDGLLAFRATVAGLPNASSERPKSALGQPL